jgi:ribosomal protein S18 acetylase RimI-like enzyme
MDEGHRLRRADAQDREFLRRLFEETEQSLQALPQELRGVLMEMQYRGREMSYKAQYPEAEGWILCLQDGTAAGRHLIARQPNGFHEIDLAVLPEYQGRGLGTFALQELQRRAMAAGVGVTLNVAKTNQAERLYQRLGFEWTSEDEVFRHMTWNEAKV